MSSLTWAATYSGSYASWVAGDNLAPAGDGTAGSSAIPTSETARAKRGVSGFAANGGAATLSVRKVAAALKVMRPLFLSGYMLKKCAAGGSLDDMPPLCCSSLCRAW